MPDSWQGVSVTPDTWSNNGGLGLHPSDYGDFPGVIAKDGLRWVAGWSNHGDPEQFGQLLDAPLVPGRCYTMTAWLHQALRADIDNRGTYAIGVAAKKSGDPLTLGQLGPVMDEDTEWQKVSLAFTVPMAAEGRRWLIFTPVKLDAGEAYPGLDLVTLAEAPCPGRSSP